MQRFQSNILNFNFAMFSTCFEPDGLSSGRRLYIQVSYSVLYKACPSESGTDKFMQRFI
jgi:hypothetical protein